MQGVFTRGGYLQGWAREGPGGEEAMLRERFGLVLVPGVGQTSREAARGPLVGSRGVLSHR